MKFKLFVLFAILITALTSCNKKESAYVEERTFDTISVSNPLSDNRVLMEYLWDKRWCSVDPHVTLYLVPKGSRINYDVYTTKNKKGYVKKDKMVSTINKNDFLVVNSDISFFHPEIKLDNLFTWNRGKLIKRGVYSINDFPMAMTAKEADRFIEFAPLNVWEVKSKMPYLISSLEEWKQGRNWGIIEDSDIVYFKKNGAMAAVGRRNPLTLEELFRYHDPGSEAPLVYIQKDGKLIALIGQEGKLWKTR